MIPYVRERFTIVSYHTNLDTDHQVEFSFKLVEGKKMTIKTSAAEAGMSERTARRLLSHADQHGQSNGRPGIRVRPQLVSKGRAVIPWNRRWHRTRNIILWAIWRIRSVLSSATCRLLYRASEISPPIATFEDLRVRFEAAE